jgi:hypothetical protein
VIGDIGNRCGTETDIEFRTWHDPATAKTVMQFRGEFPPKTRIVDEVLYQIVRGHLEPWMHLDVHGDVRVLTLADDFGQRYIYRLGEHDPLTLTTTMEWPD